MLLKSCGSTIVGFLLLMLQSCTENSVEPLPEHLPMMKGFSYTSFASDAFAQGAASGALRELQEQTGSSYVALNVFEFQADAHATTISPTSATSTEQDIRLAVADARSKGMSVFLKPNLDISGGEWRATIQPDAEGKWFAAYTAMILRYARLAEELQVELLSVGCEFVAATQPRFTEQWRILISNIRRIYHGKLTYCANWSGNSALHLPTPEYQTIGFWNELDYIGIDAYYPLTDSPDSPLPSYSSAVQRMRSYTDVISYTARAAGKKVIFTECGIQSVKGALASPWDYSLGNAPGALTANEIQDFYYHIFIDAAGKQSWCEGIFWWNWESIATQTQATNYTVRNKPAAERVKAWYAQAL